MADQLSETGQPAISARASMLRMANAWQRMGQPNQAIDTYARLLARYPGTAEAREAAERLTALARAYEGEGRYHLALSLYEKVERLS